MDPQRFLSDYGFVIIIKNSIRVGKTIKYGLITMLVGFLNRRIDHIVKNIL